MNNKNDTRLTDDSAAAEQQRRAHVHPDGWRNPEPAARYHLVVVGAGTAGLVSAAVAAGLGARVALVERHEMGGDCLNVGCVPSKGMIRAARAWRAARTAASQFGGPPVHGAGDFSIAMARMRQLRAKLSRIDSAARFRELGVDVFFGGGRFSGTKTVEVRGSDGAEATLHFRRAIIATGGRPATPAIDGLADAGFMTNETIFDLERAPEHLLVVGGGSIGCELAQAFARLGSAVTVLNSHPQLMPREDADAARVIEAALADDGVTIHNRATVRSARRVGDGRTLRFEVGGHDTEVTGDAILVAAGRIPNVDGLDLERGGVTYGRKGIDVDDRFRTSNHRVFAIGDCASRYQFTHAADAQARLAVANALFRGVGGGTASGLVMPWCTYTSPEVAHVGVTAEEVLEAGDTLETITIPLSEVDRAVLDGDTTGYFRVHVKRGSDTIMGATMVSAHAGETIGEVTAAMTNGVGLAGLGRTIHPYPTEAEAIRKAADAHRRGKLTPLAKRVFALFFRVTA